MADGFKIADAFVEVDANTDRLGASVSRGVRDVANSAGGDADRVGDGLGSRMGAGIARGLMSASSGGSLFSSVLGVMASKMAITAVAGIGLIGILQQVSGVAGLLPALGFAGAAAVGALALGMQGWGDAMKNMGDPAKFNEALAKLSPTARAAALAVQSLVPAWTSMQQLVQNNLFANIAGDIQALGGNYIPILRTGLGGVATSINSIVREWVGFANAPTTLASTNTMFANTKLFLDGIAQAIRPFVSGLTDLAVVGSSFLPQMGQWIASIALKFGEFMAKARETGQLQTWIQGGITALQTIWNIIVNVVLSVSNLASIFGGPLLMALTIVSTALLGVTNFLVQWQTVIFPIVGGILAVVGAMKLWALVTTAVQVGMMLIRVAMMTNPFTLIAMAVVAVVLLVIANWGSIKAFLITTWNFIKNTAQTIWNGIQSYFASVISRIVSVIVWLAQVPGMISGWFNTARAIASSVWAAIVAVVQGAINRGLAVIRSLGQIPGMIGGFFRSAASAASGAIGTLIGFVASIPGRIRGALGNLGGMLVGSGRALIQGFISGITGMIGAVVSRVQGMMATVRGFFPFSPAKTGPFSGKGYTTYSGKALAKDFAGGIVAGAPGIQNAANSAMQVAAGSFSGGVPTSSYGAGAFGTLGATSGASYTFNVTIDAHTIAEMRGIQDFFKMIEQEARRGPQSLAGVRI